MENGQPSFTALMAAAARAAHLVVDGEPVIFADTLALALLGERAEELLSYHTSHGTHPVLAGARAQVTCRRQWRHPVHDPRGRPGLVRLPERRPGRRTPGPGVRGRSSGYPGLEAPRPRARPGDRARRGHVRAGGPGHRHAARPPRRGGLRRLRSGPG